MSKDVIIQQLKEEVLKLKRGPEMERVGTVIRAGDGVAEIRGLSGVMYSEIVEFETPEGIVQGMAFNLEEYSVKAIILGSAEKVAEGQKVKSTGTILSIPVSDDMLGRVIDPLGNPKDGGPASNQEQSKRYNLERPPPGGINPD